MSIHTSLPKLQQKLQSLLQLHMYESAIFLAQKIAKVQKCEASIFWLSQACYLDGQYQRALGFLQQDNLLQTSLRCAHLAARCLYKCRKFDSVLAILSSVHSIPAIPSPDPFYPHDVKILAACYILEGRVYEKMQNQKKAIESFERALGEDPFSSEAIERLIDCQLISNIEGIRLVSSLRVSPEFGWLFSMYNIIMQKSGREQDIVERLDAFDKAHNLSGDPDRRVIEAEVSFNQGKLVHCLEICKKILEEDILHPRTILLYLGVLYELGSSNELYRVSCPLMDENPDRPISLYSVGCYYLSIGNIALARKFFSKSVTVDDRFSPGWIGYGHTFALKDESDQAIAAYRTCSQVMSGSHIPHVYAAIQYRKSLNYETAMQHFSIASELCSHDPLLHHELGVMHYENRRYDDAITCFTTALRLRQNQCTDDVELIHHNLGHCHRKLGQYQTALNHFIQATGINPRNASTHTAIGLIHHITGNYHNACEAYDRALSLKPDDKETNELMDKAITQLSKTTSSLLFDSPVSTSLPL
eukprot:TRINITY_DN8942_c0_g1_i1.p1 TRINITY_DN8942_c0_g1~~TRINITY_DN8942_c0_g1_i1.p1  ORF type:complete len:531 (-),score=106.12 TRINITY_DN8942_c0_g1_i1:365-1957(-)